MTLIGLLSAKHSPGVSTLAAVFAAFTVEQEPALLVEADPAGGDLAARAGLGLEPGLATFAGAARNAATAAPIEDHVQPLASGAQALVAPTDPGHASSALRAVGGRLPLALAAFDGSAIVDLGQWRVDHRTAEFVLTAGTAVLVLRPTLESVEHARVRLAQVPGAHCVAVAVVGDRPYRAGEIGRALGTKVWTIEHDRRSAELLAAGIGLDRWLRRSPLARSARPLFEHLRTDEYVPVGGGR